MTRHTHLNLIGIKFRFSPLDLGSDGQSDHNVAISYKSHGNGRVLAKHSEVATATSVGVVPASWDLHKTHSLTFLENALDRQRLLTFNSKGASHAHASFECTQDEGVELVME